MRDKFGKALAAVAIVGMLIAFGMATRSHEQPASAEAKPVVASPAPTCPCGDNCECAANKATIKQLRSENDAMTARYAKLQDSVEEAKAAPKNDFSPVQVNGEWYCAGDKHTLHYEVVECYGEGKPCKMGWRPVVENAPVNNYVAAPAACASCPSQSRNRKQNVQPAYSGGWYPGKLRGK